MQLPRKLGFHIKRCLFALAFASLLFFIKSKIIFFLEVDTCLDAGGKFNYETNSCEGVENFLPLTQRPGFRNQSFFFDFLILVLSYSVYREMTRFSGIISSTSKVHLWMRRFNHRENEIQEFIKIIVDSFMINSALKENISPDDRIIDYYNESKCNDAVDSMEIEQLLWRTEENFKIKFQEGEFNMESTFGNLFEMIISKCKNEA